MRILNLKQLVDNQPTYQHRDVFADESELSDPFVFWDGGHLSTLAR